MEESRYLIMRSQMYFSDVCVDTKTKEVIYEEDFPEYLKSLLGRGPIPPFVLKRVFQERKKRRRMERLRQKKLKSFEKQWNEVINNLIGETK